MLVRKAIAYTLLLLILIESPLLYVNTNAQTIKTYIVSNEGIHASLYEFKDGSSKLIIKENIKGKSDLTDLSKFIAFIKLDKNKIIAYENVKSKKYAEDVWGDSSTITKFNVEAKGEDKTIKINKLYLYEEDTEENYKFEIILNNTININYNNNRIEIKGGTITIFSSDPEDIKDIYSMLKDIKGYSDKFDIKIEKNTTHLLKFKINDIIYNMNTLYLLEDISQNEKEQLNNVIEKLHLSKFQVTLDTEKGIFTYKLEVDGDIAGLIQSDPMVTSTFLDAVGSFIIPDDLAPFTSNKIWGYYENKISNGEFNLTIPTYVATEYWPSNNTVLVAFPRVKLSGYATTGNAMNTTLELKHALEAMGVPSSNISISKAKSEKNLVKLPSEGTGWGINSAYAVLAGVVIIVVALLFISYKKFS